MFLTSLVIEQIKQLSEPKWVVINYLSLLLFLGFRTNVIVWLRLIFGHWLGLRCHIVIGLKIRILDSCCCRPVEVNTQIVVDILSSCRALPPKEVLIDTATETALPIEHIWMTTLESISMTVPTFHPRRNWRSSLSIEMKSGEFIPHLWFPSCDYLPELISQRGSASSSTKGIVVITVV